MIDAQNWKKEMKLMKLESIKAKAPSFFEMSGGYQMKVNAYKDTTSNSLAKCVIDYFKFIKGDCNRINTQGQARVEKIEYLGGHVREKLTWTPSTTRRGTSDLKAIYRGFAVDIEIKIGKDTLSEYQEKEKAKIESAGGMYLVIKSFSDFLTQWIPIKEKLDGFSSILKAIESV